MSEILFRGKRKDNGEWWYGLPLRTLNEEGEDVLNIQCWERDKDGVSGIYEPVDPSTIGQYTGLTDKNGKKIFERDILKLKRHIYVVEWKHGCLYAAQKNYLKAGVIASYKLIHLLVEDGAEVIGNIHDNPELLRSDNND